MARKHWKRGRPPKPGPRKPSGRLRQNIDHGTPELIAQRAAVVGKTDAARQEAEHAIGRLYLRGDINEGQHAAGLHFARLAFRLERMMLAPRGAGAIRLGDVPGGDVPDDPEAYRRLRERYQDGYEAIAARGRRVLRATVTAVRGDDPADVDAAVEGLEALRAWLRMAPGRRRSRGA